MYITQCYYNSVPFYSTKEEAEKYIEKEIGNGEKWVIAEVVKAFETDPVPYRAVDLKELKTKKLIEQEKE